MSQHSLLCTLLTLLGLSMGLFAGVACQKKSPPPVQKIGLNPETNYSMYTQDVNALVSDSGITQYRLIAKDWYIYAAHEESKREAHWYFPSGFYCEQFDDADQPIVYVQADSAYFWSDRKLWELHGEVRILNHEGSHFYTHLLYWNQSEKRIYSPDSVWIDTPTRKLQGANFTSNERFTEYTFLGSKGSVLLNEDESL